LILFIYIYISSLQYLRAIGLQIYRNKKIKVCGKDSIPFTLNCLGKVGIGTDVSEESLTVQGNLQERYNIDNAKIFFKSKNIL